MRCCVYTRFVYEIPYLDSFIEHYLQLGFDKIIILYHDIEPYYLNEKLIEEVEIVSVENNGNKLLNEYKYLLENDYDWVLNVDSDEFLVLDSKYETIKDYIAEKLAYEDENINMFQFSWGWIHAFNPNPDYTLGDYLTKYKIFVGSKDTTGPEVWVKSLTKVENIEYMTCHNCVLNTPAVVYVDKRIEYHNSENEILDMDDNNEDTDDDDDKYNLLPRCYGPRDNTYSEGALIHINTRNMMNGIIKGLNIHVTQVKRKRIKKLKELKKFVNSFDTSKPIYKETLTQFSKCIGYKIKFPLLCLEKEIINEKIKHLKIGTRRYKIPFCNIKYIPQQNKYHLDVLQEKMNSLFYVLDMEKFVKLLNAFGVIFENTFIHTIQSSGL